MTRKSYDNSIFIFQKKPEGRIYRVFRDAARGMFKHSLIQLEIKKLHPQQKQQADKKDYGETAHQFEGEFKIIEFIGQNTHVKSKYVYYCNMDNFEMELIMRDVLVTTFRIN